VAPDHPNPFPHLRLAQPHRMCALALFDVVCGQDCVQLPLTWWPQWGGDGPLLVLGVGLLCWLQQKNIKPGNINSAQPLFGTTAVQMRVFIKTITNTTYAPCLVLAHGKCYPLCWSCADRTMRSGYCRFDTMCMLQR